MTESKQDFSTFNFFLNKLKHHIDMYIQIFYPLLSLSSFGSQILCLRFLSNSRHLKIFQNAMSGADRERCDEQKAYMKATRAKMTTQYSRGTQNLLTLEAPLPSTRYIGLNKVVNKCIYHIWTTIYAVLEVGKDWCQYSPVPSDI